MSTLVILVSQPSPHPSCWTCYPTAHLSCSGISSIHSSDVLRANKVSSPMPDLGSAIGEFKFIPLSLCLHALVWVLGLLWRSERCTLRMDLTFKKKCLCLTSIEPLRLEGVFFVFSTSPNTMQDRRSLFPSKKMINELMLSWMDRNFKKLWLPIIKWLLWDTSCWLHLRTEGSRGGEALSLGAADSWTNCLIAKAALWCRQFTAEFSFKPQGAWLIRAKTSSLHFPFGKPLFIQSMWYDIIVQYSLSLQRAVLTERWHVSDLSPDL